MTVARQEGKLKLGKSAAFVKGRLKRLLAEFAWAPLAEVLALEPAIAPGANWSIRPAPTELQPLL